MDAVPLISVILPVYNAERYLGQAIQSILDQSFRDWELIIVDDGSKDRSLSVARSFRNPRIQVLVQGRNQGYPAAMNRGIAQARGKYIARMDADDVSSPERLAREVTFLEEHDQFCFVGCRRYLLTPGGVAVYPPPMDEEYLVETWEDLLEHKRTFVDASVLIPRDLVAKVGGYRTYQRTGQDVDLWLRVLELGRPMATLTEPLYGQRLHPGSLTYSMGTKYRNLLPRALALQRVKGGGGGTASREGTIPTEELLSPSELARATRHWRIRWLWRLSALCVELRDYHGGWDFLREALRVAEPSGYYMKTSLRGVTWVVSALLRGIVNGHPEYSAKVLSKYIRF